MTTSGMNRQEYYQQNKEAHIRRAQHWYLNNPERRTAIVDKYRLSDKGIRTQWNSSLRRQYGITLEQYELMQEEQQNKCAICKQEETSKLKTVTRRLAVDHDHKTGKVRQLLCDRCNHLIGRAHEDITVLQNAIDYLRKHRGDQQ